MAKLALLLFKLMKYGFVQFSYMNIRGKSKICIYTKHLLLIINLHEQQAYTVVQLSDLAKNWHFCTPIIVNISIPQSLDPKTFDILRIFLKRFKHLWLQKLNRRLGRMSIMKK